MAYLTSYQYYENSGGNPEDANWGSYQYISLEDIVNNFMLMYVGNDKLVNNVERYNVLFHAKRGIQELNYDALKETKIVELSVCDNATVTLPPDYVNWVRISLYKDGVLMPLTENVNTNFAKSYLQDNDCRVLFDENGDVLIGTSILDGDRIDGAQKTQYLGDGKLNGSLGYYVDGRWIFDYAIEGRYGLNTETANANPTFKINKAGGVISFSSAMADQIVVIEYVSDGMEGGNDANVSLNKMFEDYIYAYIKYAILNSKFGVQEYVVRRAQKDKSALLRNARIRISNIHPGRLLMNMRGAQKWLK
ncbi:MAG: hypothetical protein ACO393_02865 [Methylophilaceae bacterium]